MGTIIKEIKIHDENYSFISDDGEKGDVLKDLSKINIFIGENNSGKSRFMRSIVAEKELEFIPCVDYFDEIKKDIPCLKKGIEDFFNSKLFSPKDISNLEEILGQINEFDFLKPKTDPIAPILNLKSLLVHLRSIPGNLGDMNSGIGKITDISDNRIHAKTVGDTLINILNKCFEGLNDPFEDLKLNYEFTNLYIPVLRGLRPVNYGDRNIDFKRRSVSLPDDRDVYKIRTIADYFDLIFDDDETYEFEEKTVFTGLNTYEEIRRHILSGNEEDWEMMEEFEDYLSENFFRGERIKLKPAEGKRGKKDVISVKIGEEKAKPIYNLGDGIQSIIIMTLPLFLMKDEIKDNENVLVFIEEPEHLLHPSLQRKLIETFNDERFKKFQFFFTTHSNHFLDISLNFEGISMFTVNKRLDANNDPHFLIKNIPFGDDDVLNLLGVRNSSVFLPNCNILVEGFTDKLYFGHYLNIYQNLINSKRIMEDRHYTFEESGGSDITNSPLLNQDNPNKLNRFFVIRDRDDQFNNSNNSLNNKLEKKFGNNFYLLNCREVENLLKEDIILKIVKNDSRCADLNINEDFEYKDYKDERLGGFIDKVILNGQNKVYEKGNNGKLNNKKGFFYKAKNHIKNWDDLSPEAQELTKTIYKFIEGNNV